MCHHEVVHGGAHIRIPLFGQRGVPLLNLITVSRNVVVVQHRIKQFTLVVLCQYGKKVAIANIARSQTIAVSFDILDKILKDCLIVTFWNQLQVERQR